MSARDNILTRIGKAKHVAGHNIESEIRRHQRGPVPPIASDLARCFDEQAARLSSDVAHAGTVEEVPDIVARYLRKHDLPKQGVCWPVLAPYDWRSAGIELQARGARGDDMLGITGAFVGIAETGTLMLLSGPDTPATVSLLPETHVAVLDAGRIVANMEQAWDRLRLERGSLPRAVNFISGPSRTADIEQTVTLGAHGPYRVLIIIVG
ncbi:MAG: lactate utilization protein C [Sulfuricaulis sp.]|nr:lactate utilization protein C [Sulfuricaulis sp.]